MTCIYCGASLGADDPFCPKCGTRQAPSASSPADRERAALERALGHQYEVLRLLGRGGMGAVYLAREKALERHVAIKVLPPEAAADAESRERFRREARVAARLTHPNIVPLHTFGDVDGMLYFVMGYVKGESLAERLRREGRLPTEDTRRILSEVADALCYAHRQGVVHRDIKPDNVLLEGESGRPMLADFGVAKAKASGATLTEAGAVLGTPHYMSPEQASGARDLDGRSDLYSLGVVGYQMLSGRVPFEGDSYQDVVVQHVTKPPRPLVAAEDTPADLVDAVMRCLAKDPPQRWGDGQQLRAALEARDDGLTVTDEERIEAAGFWGLGMTWMGAVFGLACYLFPGLGGEGWWELPAGIAVLGPAMFWVGMPLYARARGVSWSAIARRMRYPPKWWAFWWPRRWRRPGDVWDRLPRVLRWARNVAGVGVAWFVLLTIPLGLLALAASTPYRGLMGGLVALSVMWPGWGVVVAGVAPLWWARRRGLTEQEYGRIAFAPTSRVALWRNPKLAALLLPEPGPRAAPRSAEPMTPADLARAIRALVAQLPHETRAAVVEASEAAAQTAGLIASLDAEVATLAREADPRELEAVELKLRALGPAAPSEGDVRRQKRALLVDQRDLLRQLDERLAGAAERRARLAELLRTMWLQLANLRAAAARDALDVTDVSARVRALCAEIDAQLKAGETVRAETS